MGIRGGQSLLKLILAPNCDDIPTACLLCAMNFPSQFNFGFRAGLIVCVMLSLNACNRKKTTMVPPPPEAPLMSPIQRMVTSFDEYTGRFDAVHSVDVRARVPGYLTEVAFQEGSVVKTGDLLFVIDPRPYQAARDQAAAAVEVAKAQVKLGEIELARVQQMFLSAASSQADVDRKTADLSEAQGQVAGAEAELQTADLNLEFTRVTAPVDGVVGRAQVTVGNLVTGGAGDSNVLTTLVSIDPIYVYFNADEGSVLRYMQLARESGKGFERSRDSADEAVNEARTNKGSMPIYAELSNEKEYPHTGFIDFVANQFDQSSGTLLVRGEFANSNVPSVFLPGMFAKVRVPIGQPAPALLIPQTAVAADQNQYYVFVISDNKTVYRTVKVGATFGAWQVVESGLEPHEQFISRGLIRFRPDQVVKPIPDPQPIDPPTGKGVHDMPADGASPAATPAPAASAAPAEPTPSATATPEPSPAASPDASPASSPASTPDSTPQEPPAPSESL